MLKCIENIHTRATGPGGQGCGQRAFYQPRGCKGVEKTDCSLLRAVLLTQLRPYRSQPATVRVGHRAHVQADHIAAHGLQPCACDCNLHASLNPNYRAISCLISIVHRWASRFSQ